MTEFTNWAFPKSSRELKMVEFEQLRQIADMSVDEHIDEFVEFLLYVGQEYNMDKKKVKRCTQRLYSIYSLLILAVKTHSFHSIVDTTRKIEAGAIVEGNFKLKSAKAEQSAIPKATDVERFNHLTKTISSSKTKKDKGGKIGKE